jgi:hypothetical protein
VSALQSGWPGKWGSALQWGAECAGPDIWGALSVGAMTVGGHVLAEEPLPGDVRLNLIFE